MVAHDPEPVLPWRIPTAVIALLGVVVVLISLAAAGMVVVLALGANVAGIRGFDLTWPGDPVGRVMGVQAALTLSAMFLIWLLSILVVVADLGGAHRNAATNAVVLVRVSIAIVLVQVLASAATPYIVTGAWSSALLVLSASAPLTLAQVALLLAADAYFGAVRKNAPS